MQLLSPTLKELSLHGTKSFPCAIYQTRSLGKGPRSEEHTSELQSPS